MPLFATLVLLLTLATGLGHSWLGERVLLGPLEKEGGRVFAHRDKRAIFRAVFHLPSLLWILLGAAVLVNRLQQGGELLPLVAALAFSVSGVANLIALRRPHPGGLLLLAAAALCVIDSNVF